MLRSYLSPSPSSNKMRSKRRKGVTSTNSLQQNSSTNSKPAMGIVEYEDQQRPSGGLDGSTAAAEPPPGCDQNSLWWALVTVAAQRYDEMVRDEEASKAAEQQQQQEQQQQVEEPISLVVQDRVQEEDGDGDDRLVIDEAGPSTVAAAPTPTAATTPTPDTNRMSAPEDSTSSSSSSSENYQVSVRYNANMARKFPGAENRTPEQQAVRQRNTVAARQSRAKMRTMEEMLTHEASDEHTINDYMKIRIAACFMYGNNLREMLQMDEADFWAEFQAIKDEYVAEPLRSQHVVPRAISDGSGSDNQNYSDDAEGEREVQQEDDQQPGTSADRVGNRRG